MVVDCETRPDALGLGVSVLSKSYDVSYFYPHCILSCCLRYIYCNYIITVDALRGVGVRQIACGSGHTVVLTTEGEVFTWGRGDDGRLGK
jgi:hypothetical protein